MKFSLSIILVCLTFFSCGEGIDYNDLGSGYSLYWDDGKIQSIHFPDSCKIGVGGKIDYYKYNKRFIVTKKFIREEVKEDINAYHDTISENQRNQYHGNLEIWSFRDIIFSPHYEYFIIDKQKTKYYGPYIWAEYLEAIKILNVPDSLRMDK